MLRLALFDLDDTLYPASCGLWPVLAMLGIAEHFPLIVDVHSMDFFNKPDPRAYQQVLALTCARPDECIFADDRLANLLPAAELGMKTVLVKDGASGLPPAGIEFQI